MKNYVINLDRSPDRLERLETIFSKLGVTLTRIPAVDGKKLDEKTLKAIADKNIWPDAMTRGEIACFLSHKKAIQAICDGDDAYGVIFEDDVEFAPHADVFLKTTDWIPEDADIVKLETHGKKTWLGKPHKVGEGFSVSRLKSTHIMAAGYIMSKAAAARFLDHMEKVSAPFDHLIFNQKLPVFEHFVMYQLDPAIVRQAKLISTLQDGRQIIDNDKRQKRTFSQTLKREIMRALRNSRRDLWGMGVNLLTKEQWKRVPFGK